MFESPASRCGPKAQTPTSGMALLLKVLSHLGYVPENLLDGANSYTPESFAEVLGDVAMHGDRPGT